MLCVTNIFEYFANREASDASAESDPPENATADAASEQVAAEPEQGQNSQSAGEDAFCGEADCGESGGDEAGFAELGYADGAADNTNDGVSDSTSFAEADNGNADYGEFQDELSWKAAISSVFVCYADKRVGDYFEFGRYPQRENGDVRPITWRVLQRNGDHLLALAEKGLDCKRYNDDFCVVTWAESSLRGWLNGEFLASAFNRIERSLILPSAVSNNAGPDTEDRIFVLSLDEAKSLFDNDDDRRVWPTRFAVRQNVGKSHSGCCWWWLRSRGNYNVSVACVDFDGRISSSLYVHHDSIAVCPALKLVL